MIEEAFANSVYGYSKKTLIIWRIWLTIGISILTGLSITRFGVIFDPNDKHLPCKLDTDTVVFIFGVFQDLIATVGNLILFIIPLLRVNDFQKKMINNFEARQTFHKYRIKKQQENKLKQTKLHAQQTQTQIQTQMDRLKSLSPTVGQAENNIVRIQETDVVDNVSPIPIQPIALTIDTVGSNSLNSSNGDITGGINTPNESNTAGDKSDTQVKVKVNTGEIEIAVKNKDNININKNGKKRESSKRSSNIQKNNKQDLIQVARKLVVLTAVGLTVSWFCAVMIFVVPLTSVWAGLNSVCNIITTLWMFNWNTKYYKKFCYSCDKCATCTCLRKCN